MADEIDRLKRALEAESAARAEAERRLRRLTAIEQIVDAALVSIDPDPDELIQALLDRLCEALPADTATLLLVTDDGERLAVKGACGLAERIREGVEVPMGCGFAGRVAATKQPYIVPDIAKAEVVSRVLRERLSSLAGVPLITEDRVIGVLHVGTRKPHLFTTEDVWLLRLVADRLAAAIDRRRAAGRARKAHATEVIARASRLLASSLDVDQTLSNLVDVVIPELGDFGFADIVEEDDHVRRIVLAPRDPRRRKILEGTRWARSTRTDVNVCALSAGASAMHSHVDDAWLENVATGPEHLAVMRALAFRSMITVPLPVRGRVMGALTLFYGDSGRRHDNDQLALAEEVAARTGLAIDNARLYRAAREADRRKDEFLAMLGHELRNPLAPIATAVELMKLGEPDVHARERAIIERQVAHLVRLVDDLLDVSRITRGKIDLQLRPHLAKDVVAKAVEQASPLLERMGHHFVQQIPPDLVVCADEHRFAQVLSNLLNNAAKYTGQSGHISLTARRDGGDAVFDVVDDGRGISPELLPRVFELFAQGERGVDRREGGLGLGLSIASSLVHLHDGSIEAHSEGAGKGSRFTVRVPAVAKEAEHGAPRDRNRATPAAVTSRRVLVVDDNRDTAELLAEALRGDGHETAVALDGPSALELARRFRPDVALLDLGLPVMDGYELAARLRAEGDSPRLIAITGYGLREDRERSEAAGFEAHLVKPIDMSRLRATLRRAS